MLVRLEMDEQRMSFLSADSLPACAMFLSLAAHLAVGIVLGIFYFHALWWIARLFLGGRTTTSVALMIGRFALLGGLLALASLEGALPLLVTALGVFIARSAVMRRIGEAAP
jgi:F1F0 ATPase subunit 2